MEFKEKLELTLEWLKRNPGTVEQRDEFVRIFNWVSAADCYREAALIQMSDTHEETRRWAERRLGQIIREAQNRMMVRGRGSGKNPHQRSLPGTWEFVGQPERSIIYWFNLFGEGSDEDFEKVLFQARQQENLTARGVRRVFKGETPPRPASPQEQVTGEFDQRRAYSGAVVTLGAVAHGLARLGPTNPNISREDADNWIRNLKKARVELTHAINRLK